jgi:hypothetical protein
LRAFTPCNTEAVSGTANRLVVSSAGDKINGTERNNKSSVESKHLPKEMLTMKKTLIAAALLSLVTMGAFAQAPAAASAPGTWAKEHPRRAEVNKRLGKQDARIKDEVKEGEMSKGEAAKLHRQDRKIRQEERDMASQNGGHITKTEQKALNQQENKVSKEIGK